MNKDATMTTIAENLTGERVQEWANLGGQIISKRALDQLRADIGEGKLKSWQEIHSRYDELWQAYPLQKQQHAFTTLCDLLGTKILSMEQWKEALEKFVKIQGYVNEQVYISRKKIRKRINNN